MLTRDDLHAAQEFYAARPSAPNRSWALRIVGSHSVALDEIDRLTKDSTSAQARIAKLEGAVRRMTQIMCDFEQYIADTPAGQYRAAIQAELSALRIAAKQVTP